MKIAINEKAVMEITVHTQEEIALVERWYLRLRLAADVYGGKTAMRDCVAVYEQGLETGRAVVFHEVTDDFGTVHQVPR